MEKVKTCTNSGKKAGSGKVTAKYATIFGGTPKVLRAMKKSFIVVDALLPGLGEYEYKWVQAKMFGVEYAHYAIKAGGGIVNVQVHGRRSFIERLAERQKSARCALALVKKTMPDGREFLLVDLHLLPDMGAHPTHKLFLLKMERSDDLPFYTTKDMRDVGALVRKLGELNGHCHKK